MIQGPPLKGGPFFVSASHVRFKFGSNMVHAEVPVKSAPEGGFFLSAAWRRADLIALQ